MKRKKLLKRVMLLLCTALLLLGSSMTVFASATVRYDISNDSSAESIKLTQEDLRNIYQLFSSSYTSYFPEGEQLYYFILDQGDSCHITVSNSDYYVCTEHGSLAYKSDCYTNQLVYKYGSDTFQVNGFSQKVAGTHSYGSQYFHMTSFKSDIYNEDGTIFFRLPQPIVALAIPLTEAVQNQTVQILPIAVGCLALLVGSIVLVRKLRIFL